MGQNVVAHTGFEPRTIRSILVFLTDTRISSKFNIDLEKTSFGSKMGQNGGAQAGIEPRTIRTIMEHMAIYVP